MSKKLKLGPGRRRKMPATNPEQKRRSEEGAAIPLDQVSPRQKARRLGRASKRTEYRVEKQGLITEKTISNAARHEVGDSNKEK